MKPQASTTSDTSAHALVQLSSLNKTFCNLSSKTLTIPSVMLCFVYDAISLLTATIVHFPHAWHAAQVGHVYSSNEARLCVPFAEARRNIATRTVLADPLAYITNYTESPLRRTLGSFSNRGYHFYELPGHLLETPLLSSPIEAANSKISFSQVCSSTATLSLMPLNMTLSICNTELDSELAENITRTPYYYICLKGCNKRFRTPAQLVEYCTAEPSSCVDQSQKRPVAPENYRVSSRRYC